MKAIRVHKFGDLNQLELEDDVIIPTCNENEVLVRIMAAGVNPVDTYIRQGAFSRLPELPYIPGADGAGVVEEVGDKVASFKVGDRVFLSKHVRGTYAQFCVVAEDSCFKLPDFLSYEQGASIGVPYFTAYHALFQKAHAKKGQHVFVHGASGAVGLAACQLAKHAGLIVYGTAGTEEGLALVKKQGHADFVANHREKDYLESLLENTANKAGFDIIVEMLANVNLGHDFPLLKQNGVVLIVGSRGPVKIDPRDLMKKESSAVGVALYASTEHEWQENAKAILTGLQNHSLVPVVAQVYNGLEQAKQAQHDIIETKTGAKGKLVIKIDHD